MNTFEGALKLNDTDHVLFGSSAAVMQVSDLLKQRDELLAALELIVSTERDRHGYHAAWTDQARAVIAKAKGEA